MTFKLPQRTDLKLGIRQVLRPRTKLGKLTLWFGGLALLLELLAWALHSPAGGMLSGWARFISFIFAVCAAFMLLRWVRRVLMWRLRNRLIVTYIFIGVIPIVLLATMGVVAGYLFAGQFATFVAMSNLQSELQHLDSANNSLAAQFRALLRSGSLSEQVAAEIANASAESFHERTVSVWDGKRSFVLSAGHQLPGKQAIAVSKAISGDFHGFVLEDGRLHLRAVKHLAEGARELIVISNVPVTADLLSGTASQLGAVSLFTPARSVAQPTPGNPNPGTPKKAANDSINFKLDDQGSNLEIGGGKPGERIDAGQVPPASNNLDMRIPFGTRFSAIDWETGESLTGFMTVDSRLSMLYSALFSALGEKSRIFLDVLTGIALFFGLIELVALFIGVRLTRSMTKSVAELYAATQHVNKGDLQHRIRVRTQDQMATLEQSFNSMTESLSKLIAEQKEKQRLEGELAIAHEVQTLLFPADLSGLAALEVHGVCRPARTVSGDYYDFIPLRDERMVLAVGDISGKGISAALLMATVHAFVRAYSLEPEQTLASVAAGVGVEELQTLLVYGRPEHLNSALSPAQLMATLNYQLYRSTPPEKYATMFLACYHAPSGSLSYSNAGHLPPFLLGSDGSVTKLETSGTVVGLFDGMAYEESNINMSSGDIFVAYSDGITEPENEFGEFGEERLIELIQRHRDLPLARISDVVTGSIADWIAGGEQPDDVTLVLARAR